MDLKMLNANINVDIENIKDIEEERKRIPKKGGNEPYLDYLTVQEALHGRNIRAKFRRIGREILVELVTPYINRRIGAKTLEKMEDKIRNTYQKKLYLTWYPCIFVPQFQLTLKNDFLPGYNIGCLLNGKGDKEHDNIILEILPDTGESLPP